MEHTLRERPELTGFRVDEQQLLLDPDLAQPDAHAVLLTRSD
jgi:hypothetical protein